MATYFGHTEEEIEKFQENFKKETGGMTSKEVVEYLDNHPELTTLYLGSIEYMKATTSNPL